MSVLEVKNVSIRYMIGDFKEISLKEFVLRKLQGKYQAKEFWANRNISFCLEKGDMLGIIGTNGAGKSTLLKCISGIMEPTTGTVKREGNIAALLELGSGFDGELTVKENTYLRGALLGYTRKFMDETYEQIVNFAELKEFEDRPFKHLSSGMKSRLAFAIASLVQPDILILDEVLSVGDGAFRKKSEAKMQEIIDSGTTTLFVSHSIEQIRTMCNKVLWLDKGEQIEFGSDVQGICGRYREFLLDMLIEDCDPPELTATNHEDGKPVVKWSQLPGAVRYEIFFSDSENGTYVKWIDAFRRQAYHKSATYGKTYYYKIRAVFDEESGKTSDFSPVVSATARKPEDTGSMSLKP